MDMFSFESPGLQAPFEFLSFSLPARRFASEKNGMQRKSCDVGSPFASVIPGPEYAIKRHVHAD